MPGFGAVQTAIKVQSALSSIGSPPMDDSATEVKGADTDSLVTKVTSSWILAVCLGGIATAIASMVFTISSIVNIASLTLLGLAPYTVYQKHKLSELDGMRGQQNELRLSVNSLSAENNTLSATVSSFESSVIELKNVEKDLEVIVQKSGGQADRLVAIIQENGEIQKNIKRNLESSVLQNVLGMVLGSDANADFTYSQRELRKLSLSLSNIPGVTFDKENFDKMCGNKELKLSDIMEMFRNLKDDIPESENIFHLEPEKLLKTGRS